MSMSSMSGSELTLARPRVIDQALYELLLRAQNREEPLLHPGIPGYHAGVLDADIAPAKVGDHAAGFPDKQTTGGDVPGREMLFPEAIEAPGSHVCQVEGGRTRAANAAGGGGDSAELLLVLVQSGQIAKGKSRGDERKLRIVDAGNLEPAVSHPGASVPSCIVSLITRHMVHDRCLEDPV